MMKVMTRARWFSGSIVVGLLLMVTGVVIALPSSASMARIWTGAAMCWLALACFWLASKVGLYG